MARNIIFKYPLTKHSVNEVTMPAGAKVLSVQLQKGEPVLWAEHVDSEEGETIVKETRVFVWKMTGESFDPTNLTYIATIQVYNGELIFHLYEKRG